uniref:Uncharacterized protein n=1 Tax=Acrobeloides nanus TaxID=290746 RepID=A0A914CQT2_9BILA
VVSDRNPHGPKIGPDGRLVEPKDDQNGLGPSQLGPDGKLLEHEPDGTPEVGSDGRPIRPGSSPSQLGPDGNLLRPKDGQHRPKSALVGPDGKPLGVGPEGTRPGSDSSQVEPDGSPIGPNDGRGPKSDQFGPDGHPLGPNNGQDGTGPKLAKLGPDGHPLSPNNGQDGTGSELAQLGPDGRPLGPNNGQDGTGPELVHLGPDGNPIPSKPKPTKNQQSPSGKENENPPKNSLLNPDGTLHKPNFIKPKYGPDGRLEGLEIPEEFQHFLKHNEPLWNSPDLGLEENPVPNKIPEASLELVPGRQEIEGKTNEPKPNSDNMLNSEKPHQNPQEPHDLEHPNSPRPTWKTSAGDTFEIISGPNGEDWTIPNSKESTGGEIPETPEEEELGLEISAKDFKPQPSHVGVTIKGDEINGPVEIPEAEETSSKENLKPTTPTIEIDEAENFTFGSREGELMPKSGTTSEGIPENPETTTGVLDSSAPSRAPLSSSEFSKLTSEAPTPASEAFISTSESPKLTSEAPTPTSKALKSTSAAPISTYEPPRLNSKALLSTSESPKLIVPQSSTVPTKEAANGKPDHLETSTLVNPNIEIDDGGEILSSSKENEHKPVSISTSLPEEIDNATKKSMSTPEITNITSEPSGSTEVEPSRSTPGIGVTTSREAEILKSASQTSSPIVSESETTVLTTTEEDITRKVTEIPQTISSKPRDDSRPEADGNFEASSSPSLLPTKSTGIENSGQSTSPSKESPQTGITTSSSKPKDGSIPEVDWTSKTPSKTSILPTIDTENTEKLGFRQTTNASIISSTLPQAEESPKITTPPQEPIITISQQTLSPTFEVEIIKSTEKTPTDPSILLTFSTPGFEPTESETTSTGVSERKSSPTEPEKVEEFTATMPFEEIESVSKKLTTIRFIGPVKITNMHEEIDVTSAVPLQETNQTAVPRSSQETISTKKENSLDTTTISTQPTLRGDQTEIPETRFTPNTSPRFSSHAVKVETIESLTTDEVEQGASSTGYSTTQDFDKMAKLEKQRTTSEEPSLALGTTSSHATELEGQGSGNPDSSTPTTTKTISTSLPFTEAQGTKNKEPTIPETEEIKSSSSISPPVEKLTTLNSGTVRAGPEKIEPGSTKTDQEKLSPHSTTLAVQEESTSGGLPLNTSSDGLEQLTTTWPKKISPPSITPSITDFEKHPENFKEKVEPLIPNSGKIQGNTEIQLQSTGIPLKSTEIPVRVTEIPLEGTEIPLQGTEIPLEGTESPFEEEFGLEIGPLFKKPRPRLQKTTLGADQVKLRQEEDPSASTLSTKQVTSSTEGTVQPFEATKLDALSTLTPSTLPLSSIPERTPVLNEVTKVYETSILSPKSTLSMHEHEPVSSTDGRETRFSTVSITLSTQFTSTETPKITPVSGKHEHEKPEENDERTNRPWPFLRTLPPASSTFATSPIFSSSTSPTVLSQSNATSSEPPSSNSVKLSMAPIKSDHQTTTHEPTLFISIHPQENETIDTELITQPPGILESTDEVSETSEKVTETKISETSEEKVTEKGVTEESATTAAVINVTSRIIPVETTSTGIPNLESSTEIEGFSTRPQGQETTKLEGVKNTTSIPEVLSTLSQN